MDNKQYSTRELFRRFAPYFKKYRFTLWMDLFCAALTTVYTRSLVGSVRCV